MALRLPGKALRLPAHPAPAGRGSQDGVKDGPAELAPTEWGNLGGTGPWGAQTSASRRLRKMNCQQRQRDGSFLLCPALLASATRDRGNRSVQAASCSERCCR